MPRRGGGRRRCDGPCCLHRRERQEIIQNIIEWSYYFEIHCVFFGRILAQFWHHLSLSAVFFLRREAYWGLWS
jgi:hypothetical protein